IAIYARKSTESEDRQVLSIDSQVNELKAFAERERLVVGRVLTESMSAKAPGRPVFNELLKLVGRGKFDSILCWKLDRLARNPVDGGALIWAVEKNDLKQIYTPQRTFVNTGNDKFWMQLEFGMAKKYVDDLSDNVKRGQRAKIQQGWQPGVAPFGYLNNKESKTIMKDPDRFPLVRKMWDLMLTNNYSVKAVLRIATEQWGLRTRVFKRIGGGPIAFSAIYKIFTNPFYYGAIRFNGELFEGKHEPMVTKSEFDRVLEILSQRSRYRPKRHTFSFTGLIRCGECGCGVTAEHRINRYGYHYTYYHCTKRKRQIQCAQKYVDEESLEKQIVSFLNTITITKGLRDWCVGVLKELETECKGQNELTLKTQQKRLNACNNEIDELLNCKIRGLISDDEYLAKRRRLQEERFRIKELLTSRDKGLDKIVCLGEEAFDFACQAREAFVSGTAMEKRVIFQATGSNLVLHDKILRIEPKKPFFFIRDTLRDESARKFMFEPQKVGYLKAKTAPLESGVRNWLGLVEDVRTFFYESSDLVYPTTHH
ncbi:MAG: recombinase family protein, partial [Parcubacteria group bacterium]